jgi:hypothetical protein
MKQRSFGVTILAVLAGIAAVLAAIHTLQFLGIFLPVWAIFLSYLQLILCPDVGTAGLGVCLAGADALECRSTGMSLPGGHYDLNLVSFHRNPGATTFQDLGLSIFLNAIILIYCMLQESGNLL